MPCCSCFLLQPSPIDVTSSGQLDTSMDVREDSVGDNHVALRRVKTEAKVSPRAVPLSPLSDNIPCMCLLAFPGSPSLTRSLAHCVCVCVCVSVCLCLCLCLCLCVCVCVVCVYAAEEPTIEEEMERDKRPWCTPKKIIDFLLPTICIAIVIGALSPLPHGARIYYVALWTCLCGQKESRPSSSYLVCVCVCVRGCC